MSILSIRHALVQAREALEKHTSSGSGWSDFEFRQRAIQSVRQALLSLSALECEIEDAEEASELLEWLLKRMPTFSILDVADPSAYLERGWKRDSAWRQAIKDAMHGEGVEEDDTQLG